MNAQALALAGAAVQDHRGAVVGRVRDVFVSDHAQQVVAVSIARSRFTSRTELIPASAFSVVPGMGEGSAVRIRLHADLPPRAHTVEPPASMHLHAHEVAALTAHEERPADA